MKEELQIDISDDCALINTTQEIPTIPRKLKHVMAPDNYFHIEDKPKKAHILRAIRKVFREKENKELQPDHVELLVEIIDQLTHDDLPSAKPRNVSKDTNDIPTEPSNFKRSRTRRTISEKRVRFNLVENTTFEIPSRDLQSTRIRMSRKEEHELNLPNLPSTSKTTNAINVEKLNTLKIIDGTRIQGI